MTLFNCFPHDFLAVKLVSIPFSGLVLIELLSVALDLKWKGVCQTRLTALEWAATTTDTVHCLQWVIQLLSFGLCISIEVSMRRPERFCLQLFQSSLSFTLRLFNWCTRPDRLLLVIPLERRPQSHVQEDEAHKLCFLWGMYWMREEGILKLSIDKHQSTLMSKSFLHSIWV